jgi:hypothetical protein
MSGHLDFPITSGGPVSTEVRKSGFTDFVTLAEHVRAIPYGRPADTKDVFSVLKENLGTCCSKHRLLATVAHECGHHEVELMVGVYEMSENNTPGVGSVLSEVSLNSIPEAHCYLRVAGSRYDFTGLPAGASTPFDSLLSEEPILPADLTETKLPVHQKAMASWAIQHGMDLTRAWSIREACIEALAANNRT